MVLAVRVAIRAPGGNSEADRLGQIGHLPAVHADPAFSATTCTWAQQERRSLIGLRADTGPVFPTDGSSVPDHDLPIQQGVGGGNNLGYDSRGATERLLDPRQLPRVGETETGGNVPGAVTRGVSQN